MSTQAYYKDRLGFDPHESTNGDFDNSQQGYEESLTKFKGIVRVLELHIIISLKLPVYGAEEEFVHTFQTSMFIH